MTYLITGATGTVGSLVVDNLIKLGSYPRVFVRNEEKARARCGDRVDVVSGDLGDGASLSAALRGIVVLFLVNGGPQLAHRDEAAAMTAKPAGVKHLVKLSSYDARVENTGTGVWHAQGESAIRDSGIPFTFVQPSGFMSNALFWARSIKSEGIVRSCTGNGKIAFIHPQDIADVATKALLSEATGESLPITGPEALSYAEMTAKIGESIGKRLQYRAISDEEEHRRMTDIGESEEVIAAHLSIYQAIRDGRLARVTDAIERVLGRRPFTFEEWVMENATAFADAACPRVGIISPLRARQFATA